MEKSKFELREIIDEKMHQYICDNECTLTEIFDVLNKWQMIIIEKMKSYVESKKREEVKKEEKENVES